MSGIKASVLSDNWTLEFATCLMDDPVTENRVKLARFVGKVRKKKYDSTDYLILQAVFDDHSKTVVKAALNSCSKILESIIKNPNTFEDPSSCVAELKSNMVQLLNHSKRSPIRHQILTILKDFSALEVKMETGGFLVDLESSIELECLKKEVEDTIDILIDILKSPNQPTLDRINCLGLLVYDLMKLEKYKTKVIGVLKKLVNDATGKSYNLYAMGFNKYIPIILSHILRDYSSKENAKTVTELKKIKSPMYSIVLPLVTRLTETPKHAVKISKSKCEFLSGHRETIDDVKEAVKYCCRENNFSLLFYCQPEKIDAIFGQFPGLRTKFIKYAKTELRIQDTELRKCAILKSLTRKLNK